MRRIAADAAIRKLDGTLVLALTKENGYVVTTSFDEGNETVDGDEVTSPFVWGGAMENERKTTVLLPLEVRVEGASWVEVERRRKALNDATTGVPRFLLELEVEHVRTTWRSTGRPPARSSTYTTTDVLEKRRVQKITVRAQPTAAITGLGA